MTTTGPFGDSSGRHTKSPGFIVLIAATLCANERPTLTSTEQAPRPRANSRRNICYPPGAGTDLRHLRRGLKRDANDGLLAKATSTVNPLNLRGEIRPQRSIKLKVRF